MTPCSGHSEGGHWCQLFSLCQQHSKRSGLQRSISLFSWLLCSPIQRCVRLAESSLGNCVLFDR